MIATSTTPVEATATVVCLTAAVVLLGLERLPSVRARARGVGIVLAGVLVAMAFQPFQPEDMGDYKDFAAGFLSYFGSSVRFQYPLGSGIVHLFYVLAGRGAHGPADAFYGLALLASAVFVLCLGALAASRRFAPSVLRYVAIVLAAGPTLLLFGYHEFGYLPLALIASAVPLALVGLEEDRPLYLVVGAAALGVGTALHGFGLVAVVFVVIVTLVHERRDVQRLTVRLAQVVGAATFGWLVWLPVFLIGLGWDVLAGHSSARPIRPLFHTKVVASEHRFDYAVLSHYGLRDIFLEFVILGVFASAVIVLLPRTRLRQAVLVGTIPIVLFVVFFWPIQGLGNDTDFLGSAFPPLYAVGWLGSRSTRLSRALVAAAAVGQVALLYVVHGHTYVHSQDF